jgi:hypothetical protein
MPAFARTIDIDNWGASTPTACLKARLSRADRDASLAGFLKPRLDPARVHTSAGGGVEMGIADLIRAAGNAIVLQHLSLAIPE